MQSDPTDLPPYFAELYDQEQQCILPAFFWDLSTSIHYGRNKHHENVIPCITKHHTIWDVENCRPLIGLQLMMAQGFSKDVKLHYNSEDPTIPSNIKKVIEKELKKRSVTDLDLNRMSGNTMTLAIMGLLQVGALNFTCYKVRFLNPCPIVVMIISK
jgi:hypothetical protein